jgi:hypothetical protein
MWLSLGKAELKKIIFQLSNTLLLDVMYSTNPTKYYLKFTLILKYVYVLTLNLKYSSSNTSIQDNQVADLES